MNGVPVGFVLTHVDDFFISGDNDFVEDLLSKFKEELTVSKVEGSEFRFTGVDITHTRENCDEYEQVCQEYSCC